MGISMGILLSDKYQAWERECESRRQKLKANEEELNQIFISAYQMQGILKPDVSEQSLSIRKPERQKEIKSLLNYAVGCIFGRYSLDREGLCYAGGEYHPEYYHKIQPVADNILILSEQIFPENCLSAKIREFLVQAYGEDTLTENLDFITETLGMTLETYFQKEFSAEHYRLYHKRPVYWQFDSGKKHAFQALVYIHRWKPDIPEILRKNYLPAVQNFYQQKFTESGSYRIQKQDKAILTELENYDKKLAVFSDGLSLHPDDGILVNYQKLSTVLKKLPA